MVAECGFDFVCLDAEHSAMDRGTIENLVRAADARGVPALVRVAGNTPELLGGALDAGARGVIVPRVNTAAQARDVLAATRYPPAGVRGAGPGRAARYGAGLAGYLATANDDLLVGVQVETQTAVGNAAEIAEIEDLDLVFIGPGDLAVSLDVAPDASGPRAAKLTDAIGSVIGTCRRRGRAVGMFRPSADDVATWRQAGTSLFVVAADSVFLSDAARASARSARAGMRESA